MWTVLIDTAGHFATAFVLVPTALLVGTCYAFITHQVVHHIFIDVYIPGKFRLNDDAYRDYYRHLVDLRFINAAQALIGFVRWTFVSAYATIASLATYGNAYRDAVIVVFVATGTAFLIAFQGHTLLDKANLLYEESRNGVLYPIEMLLRTIALIYSPAAAIWNAALLLFASCWRVVSATTLALPTGITLELLVSIGQFAYHLVAGLRDWIVKDGVADGQPDFLHACFALQRGLYATREMFISPCALTRGFMETFTTPLDYYPPRAKLAVRAGEYYAPLARNANAYEPFNRFCFRQKLYSSTRDSADDYDSKLNYCVVCDYDLGIRDHCLPHHYHAPLAMNAGLVHLTQYVKVLARYALRANSKPSSSESGDSFFDATTSPIDAGSRERWFLSGSESERRYSICWNGDGGIDGFPAEPYLHHPPWLLCPDYAERYHTVDTDALVTSFLDLVGFGADAVDDWFTNAVAYAQNVLLRVGADRGQRPGDDECADLWSVRPSYRDTSASSAVCVIDIPSVSFPMRRFLTPLAAALRVALRIPSYSRFVLLAMRERGMFGVVDGSDPDAGAGAETERVENAGRLSHLILETPNTVGCAKGPRDSRYPSTTSGATSSSPPNPEDFCATNYAVELMRSGHAEIADYLRAFRLTHEADLYTVASARTLSGSLTSLYRYMTTLIVDRRVGRFDDDAAG
ncbi:hypothetical protein CYMTET_2785 [Cymbomonas tetramitiformis]|uniref:Uncharacterized protein n=1 Tax=Cymbomonas tetramitiformis TaxID=36881 RepID=A0AAE0LLG8_9CHLO|nr:hypothetical protein CYMTET_2910 [Cymbomonas tetramitiformis]KAK3289801.1 hypothetical protein CYMTET_2785 [Cymbomonas tetramitiformis]